MMHYTNKTHYHAGGKTGAALREAAKQKKQAESDKDNAAKQAETARLLKQKNARYQGVRRKEEEEATNNVVEIRLQNLKDGGPVNFREVGTTAKGVVNDLAKAKGFEEDSREAKEFKKKVYGSLKAFRAGNYTVTLPPELIEMLTLEEKLIYDKHHSPIGRGH